MNDFDRSDPLIDALASLATPLLTEAPPVDAILLRATQQSAQHRRRGGRWAVAATLALVAGSIALSADRDDGDVDVRSNAPDLVARAPQVDPGATVPLEIGRRRFAGHDAVITVELPPTTPTGNDDLRAGPFGPFGPDHRFHRPDRCVPSGPPDARYTVSLADSGRSVDVDTSARPLPAALDLTPFQVFGLDASNVSADWSYRAVLVLTDRHPLTYTATFADGSTDHVTSDDPVVALFGSRVRGPNSPHPGTIEPGSTQVVATDADGRRVWTVTSVDPSPWITTADCNSAPPDSIGVAAPAEVTAAADTLAAELPKVDRSPVDTLVDTAPPAFVGSIEQLRRTYLADPTIRATAESVRLAADGAIWAYLASTSPHLDRKWVQLIATPSGWRITRQSLCAMVPGNVAVDGCADVATAFDPTDPT